MTSFQDLLPQLQELAHIRALSMLAEWDQETYMPPKGGDARAELVGYLSGLYHQKVTATTFKEVIFELETRSSSLTPDEQANIRELMRDLSLAEKLPAEHVKAVATLTSLAHSSWAQARKENNFGLFLPHLEAIIKLKQQEAEYIGYQDSPYDALLDQFEPGLTAATTTVLFEDLKKKLTVLLKKIQATQSAVQPNALQGVYPQVVQEAFNKRVLAQIGFDFESGRLDVSTHPFSLGLHPTDNRITTRYFENSFSESLSGSLHEMGHALYDQGLPVRWYGTPLGEAASFAVHESQSRIWENMIGRNRAFWQYWYPELIKTYPNLKDLTIDQVYAAYNQVKPSFIRVEADEVTYNLHIIIRFELERELIEGRLAAKDLPEAWNAKVKEYLGLTVEKDADGVLQDVHWCSGYFGYFPTYALGNLYSAQIYAAIRRDIPDLDKQIARGDFSSFLGWLRSNIHGEGRRYRPADLIKKVTGEEPSSQFFLEYLEEKFGALYNLD